MTNKIQHTDDHNIATEYHPNGHRGFQELKKSMETIKSIAIDQGSKLGKTCGALKGEALKKYQESRALNPEPKKPEVVKTFERIMTEVLGARFIDCPTDSTETNDEETD